MVYFKNNLIFTRFLQQDFYVLKFKIDPNLSQN